MRLMTDHCDGASRLVQTIGHDPRVVLVKKAGHFPQASAPPQALSEQCGGLARTHERTVPDFLRPEDLGVPQKPGHFPHLIATAAGKRTRGIIPAIDGVCMADKKNLHRTNGIPDPCPDA